jgi:hypothetical protein
MTGKPNFGDKLRLISSFNKTKVSPIKSKESIRK